jgi:hypothetical protein
LHWEKDITRRRGRERRGGNFGGGLEFDDGRKGACLGSRPLQGGV